MNRKNILRISRIFFLTLLISLFLTSCSSAGQFLSGLLSGSSSDSSAETVLVYIEEIPGITIDNNGQYISPDSDVSFLIHIEDAAITATDYTGDYQISEEEDGTLITLKNVRYPTCVQLTVDSRYSWIVYDANGGTNLQEAGTEHKEAASTSAHKRPNTAIGTDLFARDGYTLTCWNTEPDGTGERIGLGSRITIDGWYTVLYAQWEKWSDENLFDRILNEDGTITVTGYHGEEETVVIPSELEGKQVTAIAAGSFRDCQAAEIIFPDTLVSVEDGAFKDCSLQKIVLYDNIETITDAAFENCSDLTTLYVNAVEKPYGTAFRKESVYADKVDLLILAQGKKKLVLYGGCSIWYNFDTNTARESPIMDDYQIINMGLSGSVSSELQLEILSSFLESGDILFHTPEISSSYQLMQKTDMETRGDFLWCGLEYNYDLFSLVNLQKVSGAFTSLSHYLSVKEKKTEYTSVYTDDSFNSYLDDTGSIPFARTVSNDVLGDHVYLNFNYLAEEGIIRLKDWYQTLADMGVKVYVSYACVNIDDVPEDQKENVEEMDQRFHEALEDSPAVVISVLSDYLYHSEDCFDTNYHLLSYQAVLNTQKWMRDLEKQMTEDGLISESYYYEAS